LSLEEGATLSGDLLCLCDSGEVDSFYSGGVDGRIHAWSHDLTVKDPLYSIGAHNGRINAMKYSYVMCLLISAGNDGTIQCRRVSNGQKLQIIPDAQTTLFDSNGMTKRVTALVLLQDSSTHIYFVASTVNGELAFFEVIVIYDDAVARYH
jgi:WD40 repeat protein